MDVGSLFSGIGGFDLGLERAGMTIKWQVENDPFCNRVLAKHWPRVSRFGDIRESATYELDSVELVCGGDPCPIRSKARRHTTILHPDMSGYFLALVGRRRPQWVVRENVPASDDLPFAAALEMLGYRTIIIRSDASAFTGQQRIRDFIIASQIEEDWESEFCKLSIGSCNPGYHTPKLATRQAIACLTTHRTRYDSRDSYIFERNRLRVLDGEERVGFSGFPEGWLVGFSESAIARMTGNAVVPHLVEIIGRAIMQTEAEW